MFTNEFWAAQEDFMAQGDARRCPHHPSVKTSSDDGMFDAPCYLCEGEQMDAEEAWAYDPENDRRPYCKLVLCFSMPRFTVACDEPEDNIPF